MNNANYDELNEMFELVFDPVLGSKWVCRKCGKTAKSTELYCHGREMWGVVKVRCLVGCGRTWRLCIDPPTFFH